MSKFLKRHYGRKVSMLAAPRVGLVINTEGAGANLLHDRIANGEAFPGERIVRVPLNAWLAHRASRFA